MEGVLKESRKSGHTTRRFEEKSKTTGIPERDAVEQGWIFERDVKRIKRNKEG